MHGDPLRALESWIEDARQAKVSQPASVAFVTATLDGRPSARTVTLKRIEPDALVFTTALWTRKAKELDLNPNVSLLWHWPSLGRQVHVTGQAARAERSLAHLLFAERDLDNRLQTLVSRQGETVEDLEPLRARMAHLRETIESPPQCPRDWGAVRVRPSTVELWTHAKDRMHDRVLFEREEDRWRTTRLAP